MKITTIESFDKTKLHVRYIKRASAKKPPIIFNDGLGCSGYAWKHIAKSLCRSHPLILWNFRGHGKSETPKNLGSMTIDSLARDLSCVLDALGIKKAISVNHSMGVQLALQAHQNEPERFLSHVMICGGFQHPIKTWHMSNNYKKRHTVTNSLMREFFPRITQAMVSYPVISQAAWKTVVSSELSYLGTVLFEVNHNRVKREDFLPYFNGLSGIQANVFAHLARSYASHCGKSMLPRLKIPVLIIGGGKDTFCPTWVLDEMSESIPNSEMLIISNGTHTAPIEYPKLINRTISGFLNDRVLP